MVQADTLKYISSANLLNFPLQMQHLDDAWKTELVRPNQKLGQNGSFFLQIFKKTYVDQESV